MKAPKEVMDLVQKKVEEKRREEEAEKREQEAIDRRNRELRELKESQKEELIEISQKIVAWLKEFYESADGELILKTAKSVDIFLAKFWLGEPIIVPDVVCRAVITFRSNGEIIYKEKHKGRVSEEISLGRTYEKVGLPAALYDSLHPEFLRQWLEAIENGKVWERIEMELSK